MLKKDRFLSSSPTTSLPTSLFSFLRTHLVSAKSCKSQHTPFFSSSRSRRKGRLGSTLARGFVAVFLERSKLIDPLRPSSCHRMNCLGNALKFTASGSVTARCLLDTTGTIECQPGEIVLLFEIEDTGIGMSEAEQLLLFLPFSQVDG